MACLILPYTCAKSESLTNKLYTVLFKSLRPLFYLTGDDCTNVEAEVRSSLNVNLSIMSLSLINMSICLIKLQLNEHVLLL